MKRLWFDAEVGDVALSFLEDAVIQETSSDVVDAVEGALPLVFVCILMEHCIGCVHACFFVPIKGHGN